MLRVRKPRDVASTPGPPAALGRRGTGGSRHVRPPSYFAVVAGSVRARLAWTTIAVR
jgi:hypothetical protein